MSLVRSVFWKKHKKLGHTGITYHSVYFLDFLFYFYIMWRNVKIIKNYRDASWWWPVPVSYGSKLHIQPTSYFLLVPQQDRAIQQKTPYFSQKNNVAEFIGNKLGEWTVSRKMTSRKSKRTRQKKKGEKS